MRMQKISSNSFNRGRNGGFAHPVRSRVLTRPPPTVPPEVTVQKFDQYGNDKRSTSYLTDRMASLSTGDEILSAKRLLVRLQGAGAVD